MEFNGSAGTLRPPVVEQGYRAGRLLGAGSTARVWLAVRESDGACFALKTAAAPGRGSAGSFETRRELNILSRFEHENLLHLHTVLETDQGPGLLLEYAPGESLSRLAAVRGTVTPGEAVTVLVGVASALAYLHGQGVVHGGVSPGNILFTLQGKPLLADLGTAGLLGTVPGSGLAPEMPETAHTPETPGSPAVPSAPETGHQEPEADVFALAAAGWLMLTGRALPPQEHRPRLAALVPGIPPALAAAVEAGLQDDDGERPDAAEFARLVFASAPAEPLDLALPVSTGEGSGLDTRRSRLELVRAAGTLRSRGQHRPSGRRADPAAAGAGRRRPNRLLLSAAAVLVAATTALGAVAVAAPEMLQRQGSPEPAGRDAAEPTAGGTPPGTGGPSAAEPDTKGEAEPGTGGLAEPDTKGPSEPDTEQPPATEAKTAVPPPAASRGPGPLALVPEPELRSLLRADDPVQAAGALAELRARAFSTADAGLLDEVNLPESSAMQADRSELAKLEAAGSVLSGLTVELLSAGPALAGEAGRVRMPAAVATSAYAERSAQGGMVRSTAALSRQDLVLVMVRTPDGWRIEDILAAPA